MKKLLLILFTVCSLMTYSQKKIDFSVNKIDKNLLQKSKSYLIIRAHTQIEIKNQHSLIEKVQNTYLVRNKEELDQLDISVFYDELTKIKAIEARIYDQNGEIIKTIKEKNFDDKAIHDGFSIYSDNRLKYHKVKHVNFPYFIQFDYEVEQKNTLSIPPYSPFTRSEELILDSQYSLKYPEGFTIQTNERHLDQYGIEQKKLMNEFIYSAKKIFSPKYEAYNYLYVESLPMVKFTNNKFAMANVKGEANNWNEFAQWYHSNLLAPTNNLPDAAIEEARSLTKNAKTPVEKARLIYEYVQNNTRYVSVQIGLGGWKPTSAKKVYESKYGDCKGLVNYTQALLQAVGVPSYHTVIYASENIQNIEPKTISMQGNHMILTLPTDDGLIFLECTNPEMAFGNIGNQLANRNALVIESDKGYFVNTKNYLKKNNLLSMRLDTQINLSDNIITTEVERKSAGYFYNNSYRLHKLNDQEKETYVQTLLSNISNVKIKKSEMSENDLVYTEKYTITANSPIKIAGNDLLLTVNPFIDYVSMPSKVSNRKSNFSILQPTQYNIQIEYHLPDNIIVNFVPNDIDLQTDFGHFSLSTITEDNQITIQQKLTLHAGTFEASEYDDYRDFISKVLISNNAKFILQKQLSL